MGRFPENVRWDQGAVTIAGIVGTRHSPLTKGEAPKAQGLSCEAPGYSRAEMRGLQDNPLALCAAPFAKGESIPRLKMGLLPFFIA